MKNTLTDSRAPSTLDERAKAMANALAQMPKYDVLDAACREAALATLWLEAEEAALAAEQPASLQEVRRQQAEHAAIWGGADHDDGHDPMDWIDFIDVQLDKLAAEGGHGPGEQIVSRDVETALVRARLVKIAALCADGIESIDRNFARAEASEFEHSAETFS